MMRDLIQIIENSAADNPYDPDSPNGRWWAKEFEKTALLPAYREELLIKERAFFAKVIETVLRIAPESVEIVLHGSRAIAEHKRTSDWDFVAFVPEMSNNARIALGSKGGGGFGDIERIAGRKVDLQAESITVKTQFVEIVRREGLVIWKL